MKNKVSTNKFETLVNPVENHKISLTGTKGKVEIEVKHKLNLNEIVDFVESVVDSCIDEENGEYMPQVYNFAIKSNMIALYSNLKLPNNINKQYELIYNSQVADNILSLIDNEQFSEIISSIDKKIKYKLECLSNATFLKSNMLLDSINSIIEKSQNIFDGLDTNDVVELLKDIKNIPTYSEGEFARAILGIQKNEEMENNPTVVSKPQKTVKIVGEDNK